MKRKVYVKLWVLCFLLAVCSTAWGHEDPNAATDTGVTITLNEFRITDANLFLSYTIKNNTDHDIWICSSITQGEFEITEQFLDSDNKTLVLRRRFSLPVYGVLESSVITSRYVRMRPGQEKVESISRSIPVQSYLRFEAETGNAEFAETLLLEIGFYNEDLLALLHRIIEIAEIITCDLNFGIKNSFDKEIVLRFFGGWSFARLYKVLSSFDLPPDGDELQLQHIGQTLNGEQVLCLRIDNVSIPYFSLEHRD